MSFCVRIKFVTQEDSSFVLTKIKHPQILLIGMEALCGFCWKGKRGLYFLESVLVLREHCACSLPAEHWCFLPWPALLEACKHSYHFPKVGFSVFILIFFFCCFFSISQFWCSEKQKEYGVSHVFNDRIKAIFSSLFYCCNFYGNLKYLLAEIHWTPREL